MNIDFKFEDMMTEDFERIEFDLFEAERALQSSGMDAADAMTLVFNWGETDIDFWCSEHDRCYGNKPLSNKAREILESWVEQYKALQLKDMTNDTSLDK